MSAPGLNDVLSVYAGSDGNATKALYEKLALCGAAGSVATNVFRAMKNSQRAKFYRGRSHKAAAYDTKEWAMKNLCRVLGEEAALLGIDWGWRADPLTPHYPNVLYIDLPSGQVSFHTAIKGDGPYYDKPWDGVTKQGAARISRWIVDLLTAAEAQAA